MSMHMPSYLSAPATRFIGKCFRLTRLLRPKESILRSPVYKAAKGKHIPQSPRTMSALPSMVSSRKRDVQELGGHRVLRARSEKAMEVDLRGVPIGELEPDAIVAQLLGALDEDVLGKCHYLMRLVMRSGATCM